MSRTWTPSWGWTGCSRSTAIIPQRIAQGLAAAGHEVAVFAGELKTLAPLAERDSVEGGIDVHWIGVSACEAAGFTPRFAIQAEDHHTALEFVGAGVGISLMPRLTTTQLPKEVRAIAVTSPKPVRRISLLVRESAAPNRAAERAVELLLEIVAEQPQRRRSTG